MQGRERKKIIVTIHAVGIASPGTHWGRSTRVGCTFVDVHALANRAVARVRETAVARTREAANRVGAGCVIVTVICAHGALIDIDTTAQRIWTSRAACSGSRSSALVAAGARRSDVEASSHAQLGLRHRVASGVARSGAHDRGTARHNVGSGVTGADIRSCYALVSRVTCDTGHVKRRGVRCQITLSNCAEVVPFRVRPRALSCSRSQRVDSSRVAHIRPPHPHPQ